MRRIRPLRSSSCCSRRGEVNPHRVNPHSPKANPPPSFLSTQYGKRGYLGAICVRYTIDYTSQLITFGQYPLMCLTANLEIDAIYLKALRLSYLTVLQPCYSATPLTYLENLITCELFGIMVAFQICNCFDVPNPYTGTSRNTRYT